VDMQLPYWHARRGRTGVAICVRSQVCGMRGSDNMVAGEGVNSTEESGWTSNTPESSCSPYP
jgi:hypothetical protein